MKQLCELLHVRGVLRADREAYERNPSWCLIEFRLFACGGANQLKVEIDVTHLVTKYMTAPPISEKEGSDSVLDKRVLRIPSETRLLDSLRIRKKEGGQVNGCKRRKFF